MINIYAFNPADLGNEALTRFDHFMIRASIMVQQVPALAVILWSDVLKELAKRGLVRLDSGSFDNIGGALITRLYPDPVT